jgi:hypothetical protein
MAHCISRENARELIDKHGNDQAALDREASAG